MTVSPTSHTPVSVQLNQRFAVGDTRGCVGRAVTKTRKGSPGP